MQDLPADEMDRLLARMESIEPPAEFLDRVFARTTELEVADSPAPSSLGIAIYAAGYLAALIALAVLAFDLGLSIAHNGTSTLVSVLLSDLSLFRDAPGPYLAAIVSSLPWLHMAAVGIDLALLLVLTRLVFEGGVRDRGGPHSAAGV